MDEHERNDVGVPAKKAKSLCKYLSKWDEAYMYLMKSIVGQRREGETNVSQHDRSAEHKCAELKK